MEITITIKDSENGKPSIVVKEEGKTVKSNSKSENPSKNSKKKKAKCLAHSEEELVKRRKELLKIRERIKKDIEASDNPAELRRELEMLEQTLIEYKWLFGEIE